MGRTVGRCHACGSADKNGFFISVMLEKEIRYNPRCRRHPPHPWAINP
jgi:hypothetical protein